MRIGTPPIEIAVRRSARARRIALRVSRIDGRVSLTLPRRVPERQGFAFAAEREAWLRSVLAGLDAPWRPRVGGTLPVAGRHLPIMAAEVSRAAVADGRIVVPSARPVGRELGALLQRLARQAGDDAVARHAGRTGRQPLRLSLRDTRTRWGSCSSRGTVMLSWRLAMAPPEVLDYVAAHEVAHLRHLDHSPAFWAVCEGLCPGWRAQRDWLRAHGADLLRVDFG